MKSEINCEMQVVIINDFFYLESFFSNCVYCKNSVIIHPLTAKTYQSINYMYSTLNLNLFDHKELQLSWQCLFNFCAPQLRGVNKICKNRNWNFQANQIEVFENTYEETLGSTQRLTKEKNYISFRSNSYFIRCNR